MKAISLQQIPHGRRGRERTVVAYHHKRCEFEPRSCRGVFDTALCDMVC